MLRTTAIRRPRALALDLVISTARAYTALFAGAADGLGAVAASLAVPADGTRLRDALAFERRLLGVGAVGLEVSRRTGCCRRGRDARGGGGGWRSRPVIVVVDVVVCGLLAVVFGGQCHGCSWHLGCGVCVRM